MKLRPSRLHPRPAAESPAQLSFPAWRAAVVRAVKAFVADDCIGLAQQVAFSSILAFFPAAIFLVALLDLAGAYDELRSFLAPVAPGDVLDTVDQIQRDAGGAGTALAFLLGGAGALWAASGATAALIKAVNRAYDHDPRRAFWLARLLAMFLVLLGALVVGGLLLLVVFGAPLGTAIADYAGLGGAFELVWAIGRWPVAFAALLSFFALVYYLAPSRKRRSWRWLTPGSIVGGLSWLALSALFALYTSFSDSYSQTYGTLASGIVLLLWLQYSAVAVLFGAELNAELEREADIRAAGGPDAGLIPPGRRTAVAATRS